MEKSVPVFTNDDWLAVLIGLLIIVLTIDIIVPPMPVFKWSSGGDLAANVFSGANLLRMSGLYLYTLTLGTLSAYLLGKRLRLFVAAFTVLYLICMAALLMAGNTTMKELGLEYVIFALIIGLVLGNFTNLSLLWKEVLMGEFFVKIGLVLLGAGLIFSDILQAGLLGIIQALVVVICVWYVAYWICRKLRVDDEMGVLIASAVSICGVSAAIAACGAIKGDPKKLSYVVSLVLVIAIPMMIGMPYLAKAMSLSGEVAGAWLGGTIDTTGAVVASGALLGDEALKISTIVKFSQNVLLGVAAIFISVYWSLRKGREKEQVDYHRIWDSFPKFVLGFLAASLLFSFVLSDEVVKATKDPIKGIQTIWFGLAFASIGLETNFGTLLKTGEGRPAMAFIAAQVFNIILTLAVASLVFGGYFSI